MRFKEAKILISLSAFGGKFFLCPICYRETYFDGTFGVLRKVSLSFYILLIFMCSVTKLKVKRGKNYGDYLYGFYIRKKT